MTLRQTACLLSGVLLLISGCAHPPVQSTPDLKRYQQIDRFIEDLRTAFEAKDIHGLTRSLSENHSTGFENLDSMLKGVRKPRLEFTLDRIVLEKDRTRVNLHWELHWLSKESQEIKQRGNAEFVLTGEKEFQLQGISGDNPFTAPENIIRASS